MKSAAPAILACLQFGCGLLVKGTTQPVHVSSSPPGAAVEALTQHGSRSGVAPTELVVSRRRPQLVVIRASQDGYRSACRIIEARKDGWLIALDSIPAAIPLLIDLMAGALPSEYEETVDLQLEPLPAGYADVLPPAQAILDTFVSTSIDFCDPTPELRQWMDLRSRYLNRAGRIIVSAGDLSRPYEIVGRIDIKTAGVDYYIWGFWQLGGIGAFKGTHFEYKEDPTSLNEMLKFKAFDLYGDTFDAIVNVHYETMPANSVSAGGIAVRFTAAAPNHSDGEARLQELRRLLDQGLITHDQYEHKRAEILNQL